jgi:hypothetical protein
VLVEAAHPVAVDEDRAAAGARQLVGGHHRRAAEPRARVTRAPVPADHLSQALVAGDQAVAVRRDVPRVRGGRGEVVGPPAQRGVEGGAEVARHARVDEQPDGHEHHSHHDRERERQTDPDRQAAHAEPPSARSR